MTSSKKLLRGLSLAIIFLGIVFLAIFISLFVVCHIKDLPFMETLIYFFTSSFASWSGILNALVKTTPLLIATLGLLVAFRCHIWNIGAEGQIAFGVIMTLGICLFLDIPSGLRILLAFILSFLAGASWASFAGILKAKWNVPEIPITLMQNFVALATLYYLIAGPWMPPEMVGYARTPFLPPEVRFPFLVRPLNTTFLLALVLVPVVYWLINRSTLGYKLRATGANPKAAAYAGINPKRLIILSMFISGGICALAGTSLVLGEFFFGVKGITGNYGFYAIVCVLIARLMPELTFFASFFVAAVLMGTTALTVMGVPGPFVHLSIGILFIAALLVFLIERKVG